MKILRLFHYSLRSRLYAHFEMNTCSVRAEQGKRPTLADAFASRETVNLGVVYCT
jgi:hypothetical protein